MVHEADAERPGVPSFENTDPAWWLFQGRGLPLAADERNRRWPPAPPWRRFSGGPDLPEPPDDDEAARNILGRQNAIYPVDPRIAQAVNAAIVLRQPLLVTGASGVGKSGLAYLIARELGLGRVLRWSIGSRSTVRSALYEYVALTRVQALTATHPAAESMVHLGPLGTALLPYQFPRVLLVDGIDRADLDLPYELIDALDRGGFAIPELARARAIVPHVTLDVADPDRSATIRNGTVECHEFPIVVITSDSERELPSKFLRSCIFLEMPPLDLDRLTAMVLAHFNESVEDAANNLIPRFLDTSRRTGALGADQLLNAVHLAAAGALDPGASDDHAIQLLDAVWRRTLGEGYE